MKNLELKITVELTEERMITNLSCEGYKNMVFDTPMGFEKPLDEHQLPEFISRGVKYSLDVYLTAIRMNNHLVVV